MGKIRKTIDRKPIEEWFNIAIARYEVETVKKCKLCKHRRKHICNEPCASCDDFSNFEEKMKSTCPFAATCIYEKCFRKTPHSKSLYYSDVYKCPKEETK